MFSLNALFGLLSFGLHVLVPLAGLIAIAVRVTGGARKLGIAGCAVLVATGIAQAGWTFAAPRLVRSLGGPAAYGAVSALISLLATVGLALVIAAVLAGRSAATGRPPGSHPLAQPYQPPSNPYGQPFPDRPPPPGPPPPAAGTWPTR